MFNNLTEQELDDLERTVVYCPGGINDIVIKTQLLRRIVYELRRRRPAPEQKKDGGAMGSPS